MRHTIFLISIVTCLTASAQESTYRYQDAIGLWRTTDNAAGLTLDSTVNRGFAAFTLQRKEGSYNRVQEGDQQNMLQFESERYQRVGRYLVGYGHFVFDMDRTKNRSWADVYRPYESNPYFPGSSVPGKYDQQSFDFTGAMGTVNFNGWRFGLRTDYKVGDLSRLRDPRSRAQLLDYKITPSVTYTTGRHTIGLAPYYNRRKEKMPTLTTVQNDPNLSYYEMRGLEQCIGAVGAYKSFSREWVDHRLGLSLNYGYHNDYLNSVTTLGYCHGSEDIYENEKHEPGHYTTNTYSLATRNRISSGSLLHEIDLEANYQEAYGDEYTQQRIQTTDAETGVNSYHYETLIAYEKRYQMRRLQGSLHYRLNFVETQQTTGYAGLTFDMQNTRQKHVLPLSTFNYQRFGLTLEGGKQLLKDQLWLDISGGYHFTGTKDSDLSLAEPTTDYAQQVLIPDMQYYTANYWRGHLQVTYELPITIKGTQTRWFARAYADYLRTNNSLDGKTFGLTIGIFN